MTGLADADLVAAVVKESDHLKDRAEAQLRRHPLKVPFSVGIELLFVARKFAISCQAFMAVVDDRFDLDRSPVLMAAARALDHGQVATVFDAVHAAQALVDGTTLYTTDRRLLASAFPTTSF